MSERNGGDRSWAGKVRASHVTTRDSSGSEPFRLEARATQLRHESSSAKLREIEVRFESPAIAGQLSSTLRGSRDGIRKLGKLDSTVSSSTRQVDRTPPTTH